MSTNGQEKVAPAAKPESILRYEAETERLKALTDFVSHFAPALGEARQPGRSVDDPEIARARDEAVIEAFEAITAMVACYDGLRIKEGR